LDGPEARPHKHQIYTHANKIIGSAVLTLVALLYIFFALTFTIAKSSVLYMTPLFFIGVRMVIAGTLFLGYIYKQKSDYKWPLWKDKYLFVQLIMFHIFFAYVFEFWALPYVTSSKAALIFNASPFITALLVRFLYKEHLSIKKKIGLIVGFIGFLPILIPQVLQEEMLGSILFFSYPELALIIAVISSCYGWLLFKELSTKHNYAPLMLNGVGMFCGGLLSLVVWGITDGAMPLSAAYPWYIALSKSLFYMAILILIANTISYNLYGFLLRYYSATFLSFAGFLTPLFSAFFGWLFLGELLSWHFFSAACIILIGLAIFYQDELYSTRSKQ